MRKYIDILNEQDYDSDTGPSENRYDAFEKAYAREKHIEQLIRFAFKKLGLQINTDISYDVVYEDSDREASVTLHDEPISVKVLTKLFETGLADDYIFEHSSHGFRITFTVKPELDNAKIK